MFDQENQDPHGTRHDQTDTRHAVCTSWSLLLPDAAEGLLSDTEQRALDQHLAQCAACTAELAEARCGAAWLDLLKGHTPEPPPALLSSILAQTTGATLLGTSAPLPATAYVAHPAWPRTPARSAARLGLARWQDRLARWFGFDQSFTPTVQPRLAMTGAMAFFSLCLTLNLFGISVQGIRAEVAHPAASLQRSAAGRSASLVRSFESIRVVYRLEARVNEWRTASNDRSEPTLP